MPLTSSDWTAANPTLVGGSDDEAADTDRCLARAPPGRRLELDEECLPHV